MLSLPRATWVENRDLGTVLAPCPRRTPTEFQAIAGTGSVEGAFGLRVLERDRNLKTSGIENRAAAWAVRALPGAVVVRVTKTVVRRFWKEDRPR